MLHPPVKELTGGWTQARKIHESIPKPHSYLTPRYQICQRDCFPRGSVTEGFSLQYDDGRVDYVKEGSRVWYLNLFILNYSWCSEPKNPEGI